jgi:hypothetical protein
MSAFIPCKGDFFYVKCNPRQKIIGSSFFDSNVKEQVVEIQDGSYSGYVFECLGRDEYALVGKCRGGGHGMTNSFVQSQYTFFPVGPEVISALEIMKEVKP